MEAMKRALLAEGVGNGTGWSLFGGEPLLLPIRDLEQLLIWSQSIKAPVGIQTNGSLLTDRHVELFKLYGVSVGFSIDGPGDLNNARQAKDPKATVATTAKSQANLERLLAEGVSVSLIVTLTRVNAGDSITCGQLIAWLNRLARKGVKHLNLHTLESHGPDLSLEPAWQIEVLRRLRKELVGFVSISPFADMRQKLIGGQQTNCTWNFCDPYTTPAVRGVDGQGTRGNCGRTNASTGVSWVKSDTPGHERYLALYLIPKEQGGCGGCRFFLACGGGNCPGEGEGGDWRARTVHCETLTAIFTDLEHELFLEGQEPISMSLRRPGLEAQMLAQWSGKPIAVANNCEHIDTPHIDHTDTEHPVVTHAA